MPKRSAPEEEEDIFARFTDPVKKKKRKKIKDEKQETERQRVAMMGKEMAVDHFNSDMLVEDAGRLKMYVRNPLTQEQIRQKMDQVKASDINYKPMLNTKGMACVFDFIFGAQHCKQWLDKKLLEIGWTRNATGYNPISVSSTVEQVTEACVECFKMACKQMLQYQKVNMHI